MPPLMTDDLQQLVQGGTRSAHELLAFLKQEYNALRDDDLDSFLVLAEQKKEKIAALENIDSHRTALMQAVDMAGEAADGNALPRQWTEFLDALKACQQQNEANGRMIHARQHQLQQALTILRGQFGQDGVAYDKQGKTTKAASSTPIAKA